jgi:hypothetical protein
LIKTLSTLKVFARFNHSDEDAAGYGRLDKLDLPRVSAAVATHHPIGYSVRRC